MLAPKPTCSLLPRISRSASPGAGSKNGLKGAKTCHERLGKAGFQLALSLLLASFSLFLACEERGQAAVGALGPPAGRGARALLPARVREARLVCGYLSQHASV